MTNYELYKQATKKPFGFSNKKTGTEWDYEVIGDVLYFRCMYTTTFLDWLYNFMFLKTPYKGMSEKFRVHRGFLKKWKSIRDDALGIEVPSTVKTICVADYSQGAGVGVLAYEDFQFHFPWKKVTGFGFGNPRVVGWRAPSKRWNKYTRVENGNDAVTKVPFACMGFKHVGTCISIGSKRKWWKMSVKDHTSYKSVLKKAGL